MSAYAVWGVTCLVCSIGHEKLQHAISSIGFEVSNLAGLKRVCPVVVILVVQYLRQWTFQWA